MSTALDAAIAANLSYAPASQGDGLTENLCEQALSRPADLDEAALVARLAADARAADLPTGSRAIVVYVLFLLGSMLAAHYQPWAWF